MAFNLIIKLRAINERALTLAIMNIFYPKSVISRRADLLMRKKEKEKKKQLIQTCPFVCIRIQVCTSILHTIRTISTRASQL